MSKKKTRFVKEQCELKCRLYNRFEEHRFYGDYSGG